MFRQEYVNAEHYINGALEIDPHNKEADREKKLIIRLKEKKFLIDQNYKTVVNEHYFQNNQRVDENPCYKILSIDGGGVRGVIPAVFLNEIEGRTSRPISHLFNMVAGTSCGGIIAAGLSFPSSDIYRPCYTASDIVQLFKKESKNIFSTGNIFMSLINRATYNLFQESYTDKGRKELFSNYFGKTKIKDALTDLLIPTYCESHGNQAYVFKSWDSENNRTSVLDVLMATSAAPTFFPPYKIDGKTYLDGGVNLNNPTMRAYTESMCKSSNKKFVLSLGTGSFMPDPLDPNMYRGQLFWAQNFHKVAMNPQEGNIDIDMYNLSIGKKDVLYKRWQVYMDEPISLDSYDDVSINNLIEMGKQYIEEERDQLENLIEELKKGHEFTF